MQRTHTFTLALTLGLATALLGGCSVADHQETAGQYVDGSVITTKIKAKIADAMGAAAATRISVTTMQGGVVQLSGFVKNASERTQAGDVARSVAGVTDVHNSLVVQP